MVLPDLYPPNKAFPHRTCAEMQVGVIENFRRAVGATEAANRALERFHVFCMIHDLEVLLLAAEEQLIERCGSTDVRWTTPVEEQNQENPPKRIVEQMIHGYDATVDGPLILESADYRVISSRCPSGFGRFVEFLESVQ